MTVDSAASLPVTPGRPGSGRPPRAHRWPKWRPFAMGDAWPGVTGPVGTARVKPDGCHSVWPRVRPTPLKFGSGPESESEIRLSGPGWH